MLLILAKLALANLVVPTSRPKLPFPSQCHPNVPRSERCPHTQDSWCEKKEIPRHPGRVALPEWAPASEGCRDSLPRAKLRRQRDSVRHP